MNSGLEKQFEIFTTKADHYVRLASSIRACRLTIKDAKLNEKLIFPPDNGLIKKMAKETIFPRCLHFIHKQLVPSKRLNYFLKTGPEKIQSLKIDRLSSFKKIEKFCIYISIMYMNYARSAELKWLYNEAKDSAEDIEIFWEQLSENEFIAMTHYTDALGKQLEAKFKQMEGYWVSQLVRIKASQKGWQKKSQQKQERLQKLKEMVEREGELKGSEFIVSRSKWESKFENIFGYNYVSDKTKRIYKKEIEKMLMSSYEKKIEIVLKK